MTLFEGIFSSKRKPSLDLWHCISESAITDILQLVRLWDLWTGERELFEIPYPVSMHEVRVALESMGCSKSFVMKYFGISWMHTHSASFYFVPFEPSLYKRAVLSRKLSSILMCVWLPYFSWIEDPWRFFATMSYNETITWTNVTLITAILQLFFDSSHKSEGVILVSIS